MKYALIICTLALASCTGNAEKRARGITVSANKDTLSVKTLNAPAQNMEYCFVHTEGSTAQDTTAIHLIIKGNKVGGEMNWLPKEKDKRKGTLAGTLNGKIINAMWTFMQEGQKDSLPLAFQLSSQQLAQKPLIINETTGRQQSDAKADYTVFYVMDNCNQFKNK